MPDIPHTNTCLTQDEKERYMKQRARAIWLTGYSGSGKSTIALGLERLMAGKGYFTKVLDGDIIRTGINNDLGFSTEDRYENIRRIAEVNKLFIQTGIITINAFISPTYDIRELAKKIIGEQYFIEVFVDASLEECIRRDPKGLYKKALEGKIKDFTGLDAPYDKPLHPDLVINTGQLNEEQAVDFAFRFLMPKLKYG
jgi:adenylylsulfate kinase